MEEKKELIRILKLDFPLDLTGEAGIDELRAALAQYINYLIIHRFSQLVNLLYRLDVSEKKLQQWLLENTTDDAGKIIADLIIERQLQKIKSREQFKPGEDGISEEEKW